MSSSPPTPTDHPEWWAALTDSLAEAKRLGFLGNAPIEQQISHARAFVPQLRDARSAADLGAGGGLPGLVLAASYPAVPLRLIEASTRRADHLRRVIGRIGLSQVVVDDRPAEVIGRDPEVRGTLEVVTARGFGAPAVTAECAAALLTVGGRLVVSEPPTGTEERWAGLGHAGLPLVLDRVVRTPTTVLAVLTMTEPCPARLPRAVAVPRRRPLF